MKAIELLQQFVTIPSVSGQEQESAEFLVSAMLKLGFDHAFVDPSGSAVGLKGHGSRQILLLGHIDTVPGEIPVRIEDGKLYGRGTVDAKGPLATFVMATAQAQLPPDTQVVVIGATEEEAASSKGARYALTQYRPNYCIIGEPSGWDGVTLGYKGRILLDFDYVQAMSHTAGSQQGSAEYAISFYNQLIAYTTQFNLGKTKLFDQLLPSIRHLETTSDGLHNRVSMKLGVRLPPAFDLESFQQTARQWVEGAEVRFYAHEVAYQTERTNPLAQQFNRVLRQAGAKPAFKVKTGTADFNVVGPIWNCPIIAYGPGDSNLDHTPHEHIIVQEYRHAITILQTVLESL